nr:RNA-directed DNA polymerase, eukaryota [Tanacetum cinerariifolium]
WIKDKRSSVSGEKDSIKKELSDIDRILDGGDVYDSNLLRRSELHRNLYTINQMESKEYLQKSKIKWAIEGDENTKFFHGLINKKCSQLAIHEIFVDGIWCTNPNKVKEAFFKHFEARFKKPVNHRLKINFLFSKRQILDGLFILNELLHWCKRNKKQVMFFKVDFAKAYDSVRWDYLLDVLEALGSVTFCARSKVGCLMSTSQSWNEIVNSISARLSTWKMKTLSIGGRLTLLKSVLGSLLVYHMSLFKVPRKVLHVMEAIRRNFFNGIDHKGKKQAWISWKKVLASKDNGGLGVSSFFALNRALLFKWVWRFWSHPKSGERTFKSLYPRVYALEMQKKVSVASKMSLDFLSSSFRRAPRSGVEEDQYIQLVKDMEGVFLVDMKDRWSWSLAGNGDFSVASIKKELDDRLLPLVSTKTRWIRDVPIKINIHAWKVKLDSLPTRLNISKRGIVIDAILCPICNMEVESSGHLFFTCRLARDLFEKTLAWWDINVSKGFINVVVVERMDADLWDNVPNPEE